MMRAAGAVTLAVTVESSGGMALIPGSEVPGLVGATKPCRAVRLAGTARHRTTAGSVATVAT